MKKKDLTTGLVLTTLFGPFGMIYTSMAGFLAFLIFDIFLLLVLLFSGISLDSPILRIVFLMVLLLEVYWTYNVLIEINNRAANKQPAMTGSEEFDFGFKNILNASLVFLACIFFSCGIFALLSLTHSFDKLSSYMQGVIFFMIFVVILFSFSFKRKSENASA